MKGKALSEKAKRLIRNFEKAVKDNEWLGAQPPEEWDSIITEYGKAKSALAVYIYSLEQKKEQESEGSKD